MFASGTQGQFSLVEKSLLNIIFIFFLERELVCDWRFCFPTHQPGPKATLNFLSSFPARLSHHRIGMLHKKLTNLFCQQLYDIRKYYPHFTYLKTRTTLQTCFGCPVWDTGASWVSRCLILLYSESSSQRVLLKTWTRNTGNTEKEHVICPHPIQLQAPNRS